MPYKKGDDFTESPVKQRGNIYAMRRGHSIVEARNLNEHSSGTLHLSGFKQKETHGSLMTRPLDRRRNTMDGGYSGFSANGEPM